jgi:hypothetical protein
VDRSHEVKQLAADRPSVELNPATNFFDSYVLGSPNDQKNGLDFYTNL